jgi:hypothetical protein
MPLPVPQDIEVLCRHPISAYPTKNQVPLRPRPKDQKPRGHCTRGAYLEAKRAKSHVAPIQNQYRSLPEKHTKQAPRYGAQTAANPPKQTPNCAETRALCQQANHQHQGPEIPAIMQANGYELIEFCGPGDLFVHRNFSKI